MDFGRTEDEDDAGRRFLECFKERVEGSGRKHMHFVDDEDLVGQIARGDAGGGDDVFAHVVHLGVAGGVDLDDVEVASGVD
jgi:hypothetical protein